MSVLGNETFAFPLSVALLWSVIYAAKTRPDVLHPWLIMGAVAGIGYTVKLLYLDVAVAAMAVVLVDSWWTRREFSGFARGALIRAILVALGFGLAAGTTLLLVVGYSSTRALLKFHSSMFRHSGLYGSGPDGFVSIDEVGKATAGILNGPLPYLLAIATLLLALAILDRWRNGTLDRAIVLWATASVAGALASTAAVLKHYGGHYEVAMAAWLPFLFVVALQLGRWKWLAAALICAGLVRSASLAEAFFQSDMKAAEAMAGDEPTIAQLPLAPGEARLWTYNVRSRYFAEGFVAINAGRPSSVMKALSAPGRREYSSMLALDMPYRYIVLDKSYFRDADAVSGSRGSLEPTGAMQIAPRAGDRIHVLNEVIVVERTGPLDARPPPGISTSPSD